MIEHEFLTRKQVARLFGVSLSTVTRWAGEGRMPCIVTPGGQHRYPREAVEALLEALHRDLSRSGIART